MTTPEAPSAAEIPLVRPYDCHDSYITEQRRRLNSQLEQAVLDNLEAGGDSYIELLIDNLRSKYLGQLERSAAAPEAVLQMADAYKARQVEHLALARGVGTLLAPGLTEHDFEHYVRDLALAGADIRVDWEQVVRG